ncbi:MAG: hypothetical protein IJ371_05065 [Clostridia bacterium]|nr:hypothetical protein [Clostridia bacterium]
MAYKPFKKNSDGSLTEIPIFADMASKDAKGNIIDETYAKVEYDLVITTQAEFDSFCTSIKGGTSQYESVLLVGNGGSFAYTRSGALTLPSNIIRFEGKDKPKIIFTNIATYRTSVFNHDVTEDNKPLYVTRGIDIEVQGITDLFYGFRGFYQISDCSITTTISTVKYGFYECYNMKNCNCEGLGIYYCYYLDNCKAYNFQYCNYINQAKSCATTTAGFYNCNYLSYCEGASDTTFLSYSNCKYLYCCNGTMIRDSAGQSYVFGACYYLHGCKAENYTNAQNGWIHGFYNCSYLNFCTANSTTTYKTLGFHECQYVSNCSTTLKGKNVTAYDRCTNLSDCIGVVTGTGTDYAYDYSNGYEYCEKMTNCEITITDIRSYGYYYCTQVSNCRASTIGFADVERTDGYGFNGCKYLSNCKSGTDGNQTSLLYGTNTHVDSETVGD